MRTLLVAATLLLGACGSGGGGSSGDATFGDKGAAKSEEPPAPGYHSMFIEDAAALPPCVPAAEGWLVYVKAESTFKACAAGTWTAIDIKGEAGAVGAVGAAGADGKDGADGAAGIDNHIISSISCAGTLQDTAINVRYSAALMASGDVFATASVDSADIGASRSEFFSAQQNGAHNGGVVVRFDLLGGANAGFWLISLDTSTLVVTADYFDGDGDMSWSMTPDKCVGADY